MFSPGMILTPARLNAPTAYKTSDTSRTLTTTLTADPDLSVSVIANAVYVVSLYAPHTYDALCDFKFSWTAPTGSAMTNWTADWRTVDGTEISGAFSTLSTVVPLTSASGTFTQPLWAHGLLVVGGTAGTFGMTWAQNTSHANAATVKTGSLLRLERVA
ncbi:hypothetical protein V6U89_29860 [Micromonospora sp. CPCC 206171]|uniref:hypothetical protein n=1 Tax=Micromonospora sp. CPCC 206171 TaxID=3122405 RepID=UPI002FEFA3E7